jgi:dienelactone hydrolase
LDVRLEPDRKTINADLFHALSQLEPGTSTLDDLYRLAGSPSRRKDLADGVVLLYPSLWKLYPNTVLLDGSSGVVRFVAIENISLHIFNLRNMQDSLGFPLIAGAAEAYPDGFQRLYFPGTGTAVIMDRKYPAEIRYVQKFPKDITLQQYQAREGFLRETYAFTAEAGQVPEPAFTPPARPALTQAALPPAPQRIAFKSQDGTPLVGTYYPAGINPAPLVVLMHSRGRSKQLWDEWGMVEWLRNRGLPNPGAPAGVYPAMPAQLSFAVFAFDYRGHGESAWINDDPQGWLLDALAAVQLARRLPGVDPERLITMGASIGADGAIDACVEGCLGSLSLSPNNYMNVPYHAAVAALDFEQKPAWCLASMLDMGCPARAAGAHYRAIVYPGQRHGVRLLDASLEPSVGQTILDFLLLCLKPAS